MFFGQQDNAEGLDPDRTITYSVFCERCGYNLHYSTYVGRCNECGNPYNARPLMMKGIFSPHTLRFPLSDMLLAILCLGIAFVMIRAGINPVSPWRLVFGGVFGLFGILYVRLSARLRSHFIRFSRVLRRVRDEEEE